MSGLFFRRIYASGKGASENITGKCGWPADDEVDRPKRPHVEEVKPARPAPTNVTVKRGRVRTLIYVGRIRH